MVLFVVGVVCDEHATDRTATAKQRLTANGRAIFFDSSGGSLRAVKSYHTGRKSLSCSLLGRESDPGCHRKELKCRENASGLGEALDPFSGALRRILLGEGGGHGVANARAADGFAIDG